MALIYDTNVDFEVHDASVPETEYETPAIDTSLGVLFAGFTSRGLHNKIIERRSPSALKTSFGDDFVNWGKYGQTNHEAMRAAKNRARVFYCSLIPDDAKVAYSLFGVSVKEISGIPVYMRSDTELTPERDAIVSPGKGSFVLDKEGNKIPVKVIDSESGEEVAATADGVELKVTTKELPSTSFDTKGNPVFDGEPITTVDGEVTETFYPLYMFHYYSRGKGGNYFGYKVVRDTRRDKKATDGRRYKLRFYELLSTGKYSDLYDGNEYDFSFNPDAQYSEEDTESEALKNVYINLDDSSENVPLQLTVFEESYNALINKIDELGANEEEKLVDIDVLTGLFKNGTQYNKIRLADTSIDVTNMIITLDGGDDGSIQVGNVVNGVTITEELANNAKEELLLKFFNCDVDDDIFDIKITDIDVLPDCNYPDIVKKKILSVFAEYRKDIKIAIDLGINNSYDEAFAKYQELGTYVGENPWMVSFFGHSGYLNDRVIDKTPRTITAVYDWIGGLANEFANGAAFQMHAGSKHGRVNYIKPSWVAKPCKANYLEEAEEIGINTIQYLNKAKDLVWFGETSQYLVDGSKFLSDRNALVVGRLMRMCAGILPYYKYDDQSIATTLRDAKKNLNDNVSLAGIPSTIGVDFDLYQTKQDKKEENAHCAIDVYFPDYAKKFHVVITARRQENSE